MYWRKLLLRTRPVNRSKKWSESCGLGRTRNPQLLFFPLYFRTYDCTYILGYSFWIYFWQLQNVVYANCNNSHRTPDTAFRINLTICTHSHLQGSYSSKKTPHTRCSVGAYHTYLKILICLFRLSQTSWKGLSTMLISMLLKQYTW